MQPFASVILCTHNPRPHYLRRVLEALRAQTVPFDRWELLLVDNASEQRLANVWDISWHPRGRHILEEELGVANARTTGLKESRGELIVFVDDDNVFAADYLEQAEAISKRFSNLGVFGSGNLQPEFAVEPPPELVGNLDLIAVRTVKSAFWTNNICDVACMPWGAGLCVNRRIVKPYLELMETLRSTGVIGRRGSRLFSGEDDTFSWACVKEGEGFGIFPELRLTHLIWEGRLTQRYFIRLFHDHTFSQAVLRYLLAATPPRAMKPSKFPLLLAHGIKNGQFSMRRQWAMAKGEDAAARFVSQNQMRPLMNLATRGRSTNELRDAGIVWGYSQT
jgi:glycosyltransferase involved in cell wall biosynthesis